MKLRLSKVHGRILFAAVALLMFLPLFFLHPVHGRVNFPEASACIGTVFLYFILARLISRLQLTSVLISVVIFTVAVFGLSLYIEPSVPGEIAAAGETAAMNASGEEAPVSSGADSLPDSIGVDIQSRIDSLATSSGRAIRNVGLFDGSGTVGMTLGAVGEMTSATAEIFIRTIYAGSNVALDDTLALSEESLKESVHPLKVLALVGTILFSVALLASLRHLVLVERKKGTLLWLRMLMIILALRIIYISLGLEDLIRPAITGFSDSDIILSISPLYVLLFLFAIINAFRTEWVHYLNRWRKYLALVGSLSILILSQSVLRVYFGGGLTICSLALGTLIGAVFTVLFIFSSVAFVKILFLLPSARLVDRRLNQLRIMDGLGQSIYSTFDEERIIRSSVTLGRKFSGADSCWAVKMEDGEFGPWQSTGKGETGLLFPVEWHCEVRSRLEKTGDTLLLSRYPSNTLARMASKTSPVPGSLIASLLRIRKKTFGILYASTGRQFGFMSETRALFETFARQVAAAVDNARMIETELERERYREEIAIARSIQEGLLPGEIPEMKTMDIAGISVPSMQVGGDYYDVFPVSEGLYGVAIADVAGKGMAAALLMAALQSALHAIAPGFRKKVGETVQRLNSVMSGRMPDDKFITFFYGVLDSARGTLDYCCAGHDPPILIDGSGNVKRLDEGGLVLGVAGGESYVTARIRMKVGDRLLLFTDGITENMKKDTEEEFGVDRLVDFLVSHDDLHSGTLLQDLLDRLETFRGETAAMDDMTLLMITRTRKTSTRRRTSDG
ncbi:MAG: SpoIIE family protein phosphatase [Candidatus Fermentibacteraceae bacterium]|nr:SpoIIE family protein phosphatase [Candidatus Fermentibacteraceae bacterium]MBN2609476.1 SpoIIE family protein phosphatase [Candidatus Fermentibacteraceae bacterium]